MDRRLSEAEWKAWQDVCRLLRENGVVTEADLQASVSANETNGAKVLNAIRKWGAANVQLEIAAVSDV